MEEKLRIIRIADVVNKHIMVEMATHLLTANTDSKRKWVAIIISKDTYEKAKKEYHSLQDLVLYTAVYEIIHALAYGYLKSMNVTIEHSESIGILQAENPVLCIHSVPLSH